MAEFLLNFTCLGNRKEASAKALSSFFSSPLLSLVPGKQLQEHHHPPLIAFISLLTVSGMLADFHLENNQNKSFVRRMSPCLFDLLPQRSTCKAIRRFVEHDADIEEYDARGGVR